MSDPVETFLSLVQPPQRAVYTGRKILRVDYGAGEPAFVESETILPAQVVGLHRSLDRFWTVFLLDYYAVPIGAVMVEPHVAPGDLGEAGYETMAAAAIFFPGIPVGPDYRRVYPYRGAIGFVQRSEAVRRVPTYDETTGESELLPSGLTEEHPLYSRGVLRQSQIEEHGLDALGFDPAQPGGYLIATDGRMFLVDPDQFSLVEDVEKSTVEGPPHPTPLGRVRISEVSGGLWLVHDEQGAVGTAPTQRAARLVAERLGRPSYSKGTRTR